MPRVSDAPNVPESLLTRIRADPARAPEYIALAASDKHGPAAKTWVAEQHGSPDRIARKAKRMHARYARASGAVTGIGGIVTMVPDMAAAVWIQSRMVFFVAAAYGYDPLDRMRPAELLVLYDLYENPVAAREALDGAGRTLAEAAVDRALNGREDDTLLARLTTMVVKRGAARMAGRAIPGFAILANSIGNEQGLRALADRAIAFYRV
jgi:hypothetical protein